MLLSSTDDAQSHYVFKRDMQISAFLVAEWAQALVVFTWSTSACDGLEKDHVLTSAKRKSSVCRLLKFRRGVIHNWILYTMFWPFYNGVVATGLKRLTRALIHYTHPHKNLGGAAGAKTIASMSNLHTLNAGRWPCERRRATYSGRQAWVTWFVTGCTEEEVSDAFQYIFWFLVVPMVDMHEKVV